MPSLKQTIIRDGLEGLYFTGAHVALKPLVGGVGAEPNHDDALVRAKGAGEFERGPARVHSRRGTEHRDLAVLGTALHGVNRILE